MDERGDAKRPGAFRRTSVSALLVVWFLVGALASVLLLSLSVPLDSLATPTPLTLTEIAVGAGLFLGVVAVMRPARTAFERSDSRVCRAMRKKITMGRPARAVAALLLAGGTFAFVFWALADVLGGYQGYNYAFARYTVLARIYNGSVGLVPYVGGLDKGSQATIFLGLAMLGLVALRLRSGVGAALKDAATLFAAPLLVVFELALWSQAPEDMTWHVTDFLWLGGLADGGYRARDFVRVPFVNYPPVAGGHYVGTYVGGEYLFSNWIVLFVALALVASRLPGLSFPSSHLWPGRGDRGRPERQPEAGMDARTTRRQPAGSRLMSGARGYARHRALPSADSNT